MTRARQARPLSACVQYARDHIEKHTLADGVRVCVPSLKDTDVLRATARLYALSQNIWEYNLRERKGGPAVQASRFQSPSTYLRENNPGMSLFWSQFGPGVPPPGPPVVPVQPGVLPQQAVRESNEARSSAVNWLLG